MIPGNSLRRDAGGPPSVSPTAPTHEHVFNDDLLMHDEDVAYARSRFPEIIHVLDYPRLRKRFAAYETEANQARDRVRSLGFTAVVSAVLALMSIAPKPVWPHAPWTRWFALLIELGGMLSGLVAAGGMWLGPWKRRWLESRLMTERLRQWYFQLLVRRGQQIEASCNGENAVAAFNQERDRWFDDVLKAYEGKLDSRLESLANEPNQVSAWLHDPATVYGSKSAVLPQIFLVYGRLRLDHQYAFAVYKLRKVTDQPLWRFLKWPANRQSVALSGLVSACFVGALICSAALIYGHAFGIAEDVELYVRTGAIVAALMGGALRTIQEGLALDQEIERYSDYRGRTAQLRYHFNHCTEAKERLHLMAEMELASVDEMKAFLRTHYQAGFVLQ